MLKHYAVYKGDTFLFEGTAEECAKYFKVKKQTIYFINTKRYKERMKNSKNAKVAITIEEA